MSNVKRELKQPVSREFLTKLKSKLGYGKGRVLASESGVTYQAISDVLKEKKATKTTVEKLEKVIN